MSRGNGYKGSEEIMNSGAQGNMEIIPFNNRGKKYSFYTFQFKSKVSPVTVKINNEQICLDDDTFSMGRDDCPISSFVVVTPNVQFTWIGAFV